MAQREVRKNEVIMTTAGQCQCSALTRTTISSNMADRLARGAENQLGTIADRILAYYNASARGAVVRNQVFRGRGSIP